jgi:RelA/SpoT family (p)ppGpp synthetase
VLLSMVNDIRVMLVKFADRLHNMRTLEYLPPERRLRMAKETLDIYAPFAHRFGLAQIKWELEDLSFKHIHPQEYEQISRQLRSKRREREHYINRFVQPLKQRLTDEGLNFEIAGRPKHLYSIYNKMLKRNKPLEEIYDLFAVRIVLDTNENSDCFFVYGVVTELYKPIPERFKDYISIPKKNGYQSIHTTVIGPDGRMVEVQVRTKAMHDVAERGVAAHWMYKENKASLDQELESWISWVREIFDQKDANTPRELMESFKLNLYQDEIYIFTPKGDLKILPRGATPVDYAFEIHSNVGMHCIGAKVNGRIVPLNTLLRSGDQVEIITSKNQSPNPGWEKFVVTHKAKSHIRRIIREASIKRADEGKELWEKKIKRRKVQVPQEDLDKFLHSLKYNDQIEFFTAIADQKVELDSLVEQFVLRTKTPNAEGGETEIPNDTLFDKFVNTARDITSGISLFGMNDNFMHQYAKCCNPIPGDEIVGFVTTGEGIKIHRKECRNIISLRLAESARVVDVSWPQTNTVDFIAGLHITGEDRPGLLSDITHAIAGYQNTNIRSANVDSKGTFFDGKIIVYVKDTLHLSRVVDKVKKVQGVLAVERYSG